MSMADATSLSDEAQMMIGSDLVIVDSYSVNEEYFSAIRKHSKVVVIMDYPVPYIVDVDCLIMPHFIRNPDQVNTAPDTIRLIGSEFFIFRPEFRQQHKRTHRKEAKDILVSFGAADIHNVTCKVAEALSESAGQTIHFVIGNSFAPQAEELLRKITDSAMYEARFYHALKNLSGLMKHADIGIAPLSTTAYELCVTATPAIGIVTGEDQVIVAQGFGQHDVIDILGWHEEITPQHIRASVHNLCGNFEERVRRGSAGRAITDGNGVYRVMDAIQRMT